MCQCGCGEEAAEGKRYINHHYSRVRFGATTSNFKGGRVTDSRGYVYRLVHEDHPHFTMAFKRGDSWYILEHRLVMAEYINRSLRQEETVHHKNEIKGDNRTENLALYHSPGAHIGHHNRLRVINVNPVGDISLEVAKDGF